MPLPHLPDELWIDIIFYSGFDDVWTLASSKNVENIWGPEVNSSHHEYYMGDPWFFVGPDDVFEVIFNRPPLV